MIFLCHQLSAQELFVYTEPASNMATNSIGIRLNNSLEKQDATGKYNYYLNPEIMFGLSKKIMAHAEAYLNNENGSFKTVGTGAYVKYRFYSDDDVHKHFRMAAYLRGAYNVSGITQPAINLSGFNSGYEAGIVATKLLNKIALSASSSLLHATDNGNSNKFFYGNNDRNAIGYSFSFGKLLLPKEYVSYNQTNINAMLEILGQTNLATGKNFTDLAPSVQFIILSKMRVDLGYRFALAKDLYRTANNTYLLRIEYNFFNVFK